MSAINSDHLKQKNAAEFIEDWADQIMALSKEDEAMSPKAAAAALLNLTIETAREVNSKVDDFGESMSAMERIEAKNQEQIPAALKFKCVPYQGLEEREFVLRVSILTGDTKPAIKLRIIQLEAMEESIAEEFKDNVAASFDGLKIKTFIGEA